MKKSKIATLIILTLCVVPVTSILAQDAAPPKETIENSDKSINNDGAVSTMGTNEEMGSMLNDEATNEGTDSGQDNLGADDENVSASAFALMNPTDEKSPLVGEVEFLETPEGVNIYASFSNVPNPGKHGIHIHENGSCDEAGKAAGGHYNPDGVQHGFLPKDGATAAHSGDMGNIDINDKGEGSLSILLPGVTLKEGKHSLVGKTVILHEKEDDFSQPTGNAGGRIACGVIELDE